jgi:DNA-directed RNA polymerase subunit RPC12/RpoP
MQQVTGYTVLVTVCDCPHCGHNIEYAGVELNIGDTCSNVIDDTEVMTCPSCVVKFILHHAQPVF